MKITRDIAEERGYSIVDDYELHERYDEDLDDVWGEARIAGMDYQTSSTLKEIDEVAYRTGFNDWLDNESRDGRFTELDDGEFMLTDDYDSLVEEIEEEEEEQKDKE